MPQTIHIPRKLNTSDAEHDSTSNAKRVKLVDSALTIENADINIGDVGLVNISGDDINPATEDKQDTIITAINDINSKSPTLGDYYTNDLDQATSKILYVGQSKPDGTWLIKVINDTTETTRYANVSNNGTQTTYALAWTNHLTLTYDEIHDLTF